MKNPILGIIGGGQLGSLLSVAANKIGIKTPAPKDFFQQLDSNENS